MKNLAGHPPRPDSHYHIPSRPPGRRPGAQGSGRLPQWCITSVVNGIYYPAGRLLALLGIWLRRDGKGPKTTPTPSSDAPDKNPGGFGHAELLQRTWSQTPLSTLF